MYNYYISYFPKGLTDPEEIKKAKTLWPEEGFCCHDYQEFLAKQKELLSHGFKILSMVFSVGDEEER